MSSTTQNESLPATPNPFMSTDTSPKKKTHRSASTTFRAVSAFTRGSGATEDPSNQWISTECENHTLSQSSSQSMLAHQPWLSGVRGHSDEHALGHYPRAQCAFKNLMIHEVLRFALRITFRCVLHQCGIQDIHC